MLRPLAVAVALALSAAAFAQTTTTTISPTSQQVQLLGPQLVPFTGSVANFDSLVNGLAGGTPVTLTTISGDGQVQIVTFVPGTTLTALDIARNLENARQNLISRGVALPTAQQLAVSLVGGTLTTTSGSTSLNGVLTGTATAGAFQVRNELATLPGTGGVLTTANTPAIQTLRTSLTQGTLIPGRGPMSAFEVTLNLNLAVAVLAQQGITNPTADQVRVALLGGTIVNANGAVVPLQGVLQGSLRNTSTSTLFGTSDSGLVGTSDSATAGTTSPTPQTTPAAARPAAPAVGPTAARGSATAITAPNPGATAGRPAR